VDGSSPLALNDLVDISLASGAVYPSRVEDVNGDVLRVAAVLGSLDGVRLEDSVELAWLMSGDRLAAPAKVVGMPASQTPSWDVRITGEPRRQNRRGYVRGGGGEAVRLRRPDDAGPPLDGYVIDVGEASVRARVRKCDYELEESLMVTMQLGPDVVAVEGIVNAVRHIIETGYVDVVVSFETGEAQGRVIRSYIMKWQLEQRRRLAAKS
jgi:hypothetical protein